MKPGWVGGQLQLPRGKTKTTTEGSMELYRTTLEQKHENINFVSETYFFAFILLVQLGV